MVPDEEPLTSGGGKKGEEEEEMGKQCLLQSEIIMDHAHCSVHGSFLSFVRIVFFLMYL